MEDMVSITGEPDHYCNAAAATTTYRFPNDERVWTVLYYYMFNKETEMLIGRPHLPREMYGYPDGVYRYQRSQSGG